MTEVDVGGFDGVDALLVTMVIVILDECLDLLFKVAGQIIVSKRTRFFMVWCHRSILP